MQAWTVGDSKAASTDKTTSKAPITSRSLPKGNSSPAVSTVSPERLSSPTIIQRRLARSANIPPKGDKRMVGSMATASIAANTDAEPVCSKMYMDNANFKV